MTTVPSSILQSIPMPAGFVPFPVEAIEGTYVDRFEAIVESFPDNVAVTDRGRILTYHELNESANRLAWTIVEKYGSHHERVGFIAHQDIDSVITIWGILKSGKAYITLDPTFSNEKLLALVNSLGITLLVSTPASSVKVELIHQLVKNMKLLKPSHALSPLVRNPRIAVSHDLPPYFNYTSGTTGKPKVNGKNGRGLIDKVRVKTNSLGLLASDRWSLANPLCYGASYFGLYGAHLNGGTVCLYDIPSQGLQGFGDWLVNQKINVLLTTPPVFRNTFIPMNHGKTFPQVRMVIFTSDTMISRDVELCDEHFSRDCIVANCLGLTETEVITVGFVNRSVKSTGTISVGYPLDGVEILLVDDAGEPVKPKTVGEIYVKNRYLTNYSIERNTKDAETTSSDLVARFQRTGDLGRILSDGSLEYLGRKDSVVKVRGLRVDTAEVESLLHQHSRVRQAAVISLQTRTSHKNALVAYIVPSINKKPTSKDLRTHLSVLLPNYMIPSYFIFVEEIPLNSNGKVDRTCLPEPDWEKPESDVAYFPPRNRIEWHLVRIWQEVLNLERVGVHYEFAALGGESLQAVQIMERINAEWNIKLPLQSLVAHPTVADLTKLIRGLKVDIPKVSIMAIREDGIFPALFMVPAGARTVIGSTRLGSRLLPGRRIYGLEYPGMEGYLEPMDRVPDLARFFIQQIRTVQPEGPYHLIGQCMGGVVILEMAKQFIEEGDKIGLLCPLDTNPPLPRYFFIKKVLKLLRSGEINTLTKELAGRFSRIRLVKKSKERLTKINRNIKKDLGLDWLENPIDIESQRVLEKLDIAKNKYYPHTYHGHALLILSETARNTTKQRVWDIVLPDKDMYYIPDTSHRTIFSNDNNLDQIAELINHHFLAGQ